jgi:hypothetical protein
LKEDAGAVCGIGKGQAVPLDRQPGVSPDELILGQPEMSGDPGGFLG